MVRHIALTIARIIRGDYVVTIGERWNQVAEHMGRGWKSMQQEHDRRIRRPSLAVENIDAVNDLRAMMRHGRWRKASAGWDRRRRGGRQYASYGGRGTRDEQAATT